MEGPVPSSSSETDMEYHASLYEELLTYVRDRYGRAAWLALPRDVAAYVAQNTAERLGNGSPHLRAPEGRSATFMGAIA